MSKALPNFKVLPASRSDLEACARLCDICIGQDKEFYKYYNRFSSDGKTVYEASLDQAISRFDDPAIHFFKAVIVEGDGEEMIIGFTQWRVGYIEVPKIDPFAKKEERVAEQVVKGHVNDINIELAPSGQVQQREPEKVEDEVAEGRKFMQDTRTVGSNMMISYIRGKKYVHLIRIMVDPDFQRRGVAGVLIKWGMEVADREKLLSWVNARPAGMPMYEKVGFEEIGYTDGYVGQFIVQPTMIMLRKPRPL